MTPTSIRTALALLLLAALQLADTPANAADYDLVIRSGRVMNPANGLDSVRDIGIRDGSIVALSRESLTGAEEIDAAGLVAAPSRTPAIMVYRFT